MPAEMKALLDTLLLQNNLTREEACAGVEAIIEGADPCQAAAFLVLLKAKGETGQEVAGMVSAMRNHMIPVPACRALTSWARVAMATTLSTSPPRRRSSLPPAARASRSTATAQCRPCARPAPFHTLCA